MTMMEVNTLTLTSAEKDFIINKYQKELEELEEIRSNAEKRILEVEERLRLLKLNEIVVAEIPQISI